MGYIKIIYLFLFFLNHSFVSCPYSIINILYKKKKKKKSINGNFYYDGKEKKEINKDGNKLKVFFNILEI